MRVTLLGAGAVGGLLGGLLARAGHEVSFVAHGETLAALRSQGIVVATGGESFSTGPLPASAAPSELGVSELVFVAVKSWQVERLAPSLAPLVGQATMVVPVQ